MMKMGSKEVSTSWLIRYLSFFHSSLLGFSPTFLVKSLLQRPLSHRPGTQEAQAVRPVASGPPSTVRRYFAPLPKSLGKGRFLVGPARGKMGDPCAVPSAPPWAAGPHRIVAYGPRVRTLPSGRRGGIGRHSVQRKQAAALPSSLLRLAAGSGREKAVSADKRRL